MYVQSRPREKEVSDQLESSQCTSCATSQSLQRSESTAPTAVLHVLKVNGIQSCPSLSSRILMCIVTASPQTSTPSRVGGGSVMSRELKLLWHFFHFFDKESLPSHGATVCD